MKFKSPSVISKILTISILIIVSHINMNRALGQTVKPLNDENIIPVLYRSAGLQSNMGFISSMGESYLAFNLKIGLKRSGKSIIKDIKFSNPDGNKIFPNFKQIEKFNFNSILGRRRSVTLTIPILILNSPRKENNTEELINGVNKQALKNLMSDILFPNIVQKDIILLPLLTVDRIDIK